jgi:type VI secretion system Hcp family effector
MPDKGIISKETLGFERAVPVVAIQHEVTSTIDFQTGLAMEKGIVGARTIHKPFVITKKVDFTSPQLAELFNHGVEILPWELKLIHQPLSGPECAYFTITLTGAKIAFIQTVKPSMVVPTQNQAHELEDIGFFYEKIKWEAPQNVPLGMNYGSAPAHLHEDKANFGPDIVTDEMNRIAQKMPTVMADIVKAEVELQLIKAGIKVEKKK